MITLRCLTWLVLLAQISLGFSMQCKDEQGNPVDWFYLYKLPREPNHVNALIRDGVSYLYITPSSPQKGWVMSRLSIADPLSMAGQTLTPLYQNKNIISVLYNDQPPHDTEYDFIQCMYRSFFGRKRGQRKHRGKVYHKLSKVAHMCRKQVNASTGGSRYKRDMSLEPNYEFGHTKGVVLGDADTSLWLVHSVPKFPPLPDNFNVSHYTYPATGHRYGQSFLCMSLHTSELELVATQLKYNEPLILHSSMPKELEAKLPNMLDVVRNNTHNEEPWYHTQGFSTIGGRKFLSFAKSSRFQDDLYSGLVAGGLRADLLVETWCNGPGNLASECSRKYQVHNIQQLKFPIAATEFSSHHDHSKWAVANGTGVGRRGSGFWVCVGDINRAITQESRGGGTVCTSEPVLWASFAKLAVSVQDCNSTKPQDNL